MRSGGTNWCKRMLQHLPDPKLLVHTDHTGWLSYFQRSCRTVLVLQIVDYYDLPNCSCRNCSRRFQMLHSNVRFPVSYAHNAHHCSILSRRSCHRTDDQIQCSHACASSRIELADFWFVDYRLVHRVAIARRSPHSVRFAVRTLAAVHHKLVIVTLVDHRPICAQAAMTMNRLLERHCSHSKTHAKKK